MISEKIRLRMLELHISQRELSRELGIEYTALNTFLNGRKGMWYERIQKILLYVGLTAEGSVTSGRMQPIRDAVWLESRIQRKTLRALSRDTGIAYGNLVGFVHGRCGMSHRNVEMLMEKLDIKLVRYDRYGEDR